MQSKALEYVDRWIASKKLPTHTSQAFETRKEEFSQTWATFETSLKNNPNDIVIQNMCKSLDATFHVMCILEVMHCFDEEIKRLPTRDQEILLKLMTHVVNCKQKDTECNTLDVIEAYLQKHKIYRDLCAMTVVMEYGA